jgi:hypothetical protein
MCGLPHKDGEGTVAVESWVLVGIDRFDSANASIFFEAKLGHRPYLSVIEERSMEHTHPPETVRGHKTHEPTWVGNERDSV